MSKEKRGELLFSIFFVIVGILSVVIIQNQSKLSINPSDPTNVSTFPSTWGLLLVVFSVVNIIQVVVRAYKDGSILIEKKKKTEDEKKQQMQILIRTISIFALLAVFTFLLKKVYFALLVFAFLFISFRIFGQKKYLANLIVSLVGAAIVHVIFIVFLKIPI